MVWPDDEHDGRGDFDSDAAVRNGGKVAEATNASEFSGLHRRSLREISDG